MKKSSSLMTALTLAPFVHDPYGFVMTQYSWGEGSLANFTGPREWQTDILKTVGAHLSNPETRFTPLQIAVASGHGIGKTALISWLGEWGIATMVDARGVVTANTENQLRTKTWPEFSKWLKLMAARDFFRLDGTTFRGTENEKTWRIDAIPWSENNPEAFAGLHNAFNRILVLLDEGSAIADVIWETVFGALTDENTEIIVIVFGNPTRSSGRFFDCFNKHRHRWVTRQIDSRTVEGTNKALFKQWEQDYGEDSDFFRVRVRGLFPRTGSNQLISYEVITRSQGLDVAPRLSDPLIFGLDVAREGDDQSVLYTRKGLVAGVHEGPWAWRHLNNVELAERVAAKIKELKPHYVNIDGGGPGGGVVDILRAWGYQVNEVKFGGSPFNTDYANKRAEMWCSMRDWLNSGGQIPWHDNNLATDLTNQTYTYKRDRTDALILTPKDLMKRDGLPSPDFGDALALTFAVPVNPITEVSRGLGDVRSAMTEYVGGWE